MRAPYEDLVGHEAPQVPGPPYHTYVCIYIYIYIDYSIISYDIMQHDIISYL